MLLKVSLQSLDRRLLLLSDDVLQMARSGKAEKTQNTSISTVRSSSAVLMTVRVSVDKDAVVARAANAGSTTMPASYGLPDASDAAAAVTASVSKVAAAIAAAGTGTAAPAASSTNTAFRACVGDDAAVVKAT